MGSTVIAPRSNLTGAAALPLLLVGLLISTLMVLEARRYRYFNVWRARARWMETHFYAPMLEHADFQTVISGQNVVEQCCLSRT